MNPYPDHPATNFGADPTTDQTAWHTSFIVLSRYEMAGVDESRQVRIALPHGVDTGNSSDV
jgi:hypothetical protein